MKFVFITGSRHNDFDDEALRHTLSCNVGAVVVHGDCPTGADRLAERYANKHPDERLTTIPMPAQWDRLGNAAGPIRNAEMVALAAALRGCGHSIEWHAFPGPSSRGTWNCVRQAKDAGFKVEVHEP